MMKRILLVVLIGLFGLGVFFIGTDGFPLKSDNSVNIRYFTGTEYYEYGPRGQISSSKGRELFPSYPATVTRGRMAGLDQSAR